ncbi:MAG: C1 family peptidase [Saprospiraceae bacterium]|nr:C1 family peptidase [Saprospiraceae bacterium]
MKTIDKILFFFFITLLISSCSKDDDIMIPDVEDPTPTELEFGLGALDDETSENVPSNIYFGNSNLPSQHDISQYLPPIGNQGNYGTCVAWALGYNLKTMIEAQDKNYSSQDLTDERNQFSPKDLFLSIPADKKGTECSGTYLYSAFDIMQNRGIATMNTAPYTNLGDCSQSTQSSWDSQASNFKIDNYRSINIDVQSIKEQIANDRPVGFGARLADNFITWDSDQVLSGHTTFDRVGQHAGHAMTVIGYDDNKGVNGAFRVVNSWGEFWGSQGFIWIDYNFFVSDDFANVAYVASNKRSDVNPDDPTDPNSNGNIDLVPWGLSDYSDYYYSTSRTLSYNVYNIGSEAAKATSDWAVTYLYYNAFDANDYGFILYDYYSDDFGSYGQNNAMNNGPASSGNWWNHVDVPGGSSISQAVTGSQENFEWSYEMPNITGYYYLVMISDVYDVLNDADKNNNYFYMTDESGYPVYFENGITDFQSQDESMNKSKTDIGNEAYHASPSDMNPKLKNAYTKNEIGQMLKARKKDSSFYESLEKFKKQVKK